MVLTGIAGWIDKSLIDSGLFYPPEAKSAEDRLNFYASQFNLVEVDSSYYGMPKRENSENWVKRTPPGFVFDVKSFALFTHHPTKPNSLPKEIRQLLPPDMLERNLYLEKTPDEVVEAHPHITLADVHAALAYYYVHQDAIRGEWQEARSLVDELSQKYPKRSGRT